MEQTEELLERMRAIGHDYGSEPDRIPLHECFSAVLRVVLRAALTASGIFANLDEREFGRKLNSLEILARGGRPRRAVSVESALVTAAVSKTLGAYGNLRDLDEARDTARWVEGDYADIAEYEHYDAAGLLRATRIAALCAESIRRGYEDADE